MGEDRVGVAYWGGEGRSVKTLSAGPPERMGISCKFLAGLVLLRQATLGELGCR